MKWPWEKQFHLIGSGTELRFALVATDKFDAATGLANTYWIQAFRFSTWDHPKYGEEKIDQAFAEQMIANFQANTYGQDLPIDFEHGEDSSKGLQTAGWIRDMQLRDDGLYYLVEFTKDAVDEIKDGKWRYISPAYFSYWTNTETGEKFDNVPSGGAITNRPFFKGMLPLNFSEISATKDDLKEFGEEWKKEYTRLLEEIKTERDKSK